MATPSSANSSELDATKYIAQKSIDGAITLSAFKIIDQISANNAIILIDSRYPTDRKQGYIQGSISLPDTDTHCKSLGHHIPSLDHPVIFYCNGIHCKRSEIAINIALACHYNNLFWFRGGFDEWLAKKLPYIKE